jgi:putative hydrolase of the HAD superfamily
MSSKVVIFDFWDTLMHYDYDGLKANQAVLDHAIKNPNNVDAKTLLNSVNNMFTTIRNESKKLEVKFKDVHQLVHAMLELEFDKDYLELEQIFIKNAYSLTPHADSYDLLKLLVEKGYQIGLLSNTILTRNTILEILRTHFPLIKFDPFILSSEVVFKKPHPKIYELTLKKLKHKPAFVYFIGDNFEYDVKGPALANFKTIFYNHRGAKIKDESLDYLEVKSHLEIINFFKEQR